MGFNKLWLPEPEDLKQQLRDYGNVEFVKRWEKRYMKADAVCGPTESFDIIKQILDREYNYRNTGQLSIDFGEEF